MEPHEIKLWEVILGIVLGIMFIICMGYCIPIMIYEIIHDIDKCDIIFHPHNLSDHNFKKDF